MKFIVNADDFGMSPGVNRGIRYAYEQGIVRSTTLMPGMNYFNDAVDISKDCEFLAVGIHLTLTAGTPVLRGHKTIVDNNGNFIKMKNALNNGSKIDLDEVRSELFAQVEKVFAAGIDISHVDSHHHIHGVKEVFEIVLDICKQYSLPLRAIDENQRKEARKREIVVTDDFTVDFYDKDVSLEKLLEILVNAKKKKTETIELMCHPAFLDSIVYNQSSYNVQRMNELAVLTTPGLENRLSAMGVELIDFFNLH